MIVKNKSSFKILSIGNSFSEDVQHYLWSIAKSFNFDNIVIANMYIAGAPLSLHVNNINKNEGVYAYQKYVSSKMITICNYNLKEALNDEEWDLITIQEVSNLSGKNDKLNVLIEEMIEKIKINLFNKNIPIAWHMTWAYQKDSKHEGFKNYDFSQEKMYECIKRVSKSIIFNNKDIELIIPTGISIQNARNSIMGDNLTSDGYHLSIPFGRYIGALTFFKAISGLDISLNNEIYCPFDKNDLYFEICINSANHDYYDKNIIEYF